MKQWFEDEYLRRIGYNEEDVRMRCILYEMFTGESCIISHAYACNLFI